MDREGARQACVATSPSLLAFLHRCPSRARDVFGADLVHLHSASTLFHAGQQGGQPDHGSKCRKGLRGLRRSPNGATILLHRAAPQPRLMDDPKRARSRKRRTQSRADLHATAPALDPTRLRAAPDRTALSSTTPEEIFNDIRGLAAAYTNVRNAIAHICVIRGPTWSPSSLYS